MPTIADIIIIIICLISCIILILFINRDKFSLNCCYKRNKFTNYTIMDVEKINNNIKLMKSEQENELL